MGSASESSEAHGAKCLVVRRTKSPLSVGFVGHDEQMDGQPDSAPVDNQPRIAPAQAPVPGWRQAPDVHRVDAHAVVGLSPAKFCGVGDVRRCAEPLQRETCKQSTSPGTPAAVEQVLAQRVASSRDIRPAPFPSVSSRRNDARPAYRRWSAKQCHQLAFAIAHASLYAIRVRALRSSLASICATRTPPPLYRGAAAYEG